MENELVGIGLSEKEAKLYLLCLKIGETSANRIIELIHFPRGTVYNILEKLGSLGLVSSFIVNKTTHFIANDPEILVKNLEEKRHKAKNLIPKLRREQNKIEKKVRIATFEGIGGIKNILDNIIENEKSCAIMTNEAKATEILDHHPLNFKSRRIKKGIKIRNLLEISNVSKKTKK